MKLTEANIIKTLKKQFPEEIGDDAACFPFSHTDNYVISKDLLVEDTHFRLRYQSPSSLAHKALHVNLSDVAAMGAVPQYILLGLSIPKHFEKYTKPFLTAFAKACKKASVILIGGDTTRSKQQLFISITAIGTAATQYTKFRNQAQPGDLLCIAGEIGAAHLGFTALEQNKPGFRNFKQLFLNPSARIQEAQWLSKQASVNSMMDTSDGLVIDLERLCQASNIACKINLDALIPTPNFKRACKALNLDPTTTQLAGGEDYSLLFSVNKNAYPVLEAQFKKQFSDDLKCIGQFKSGKKISFIKNYKPIKLNIKPFLHFE